MSESLKIEPRKKLSSKENRTDIITDKIKEPTVVKFDKELLPESVRPFAVDVAERMNNAPLEFAAVSALVTLSAAIGRSVGVRPKLYDDWTVVPNLWGMLIAPPSIKKSPIMSEVFKPLHKAEAIANDSYQEAMAEFKGEQFEYKVELKRYEDALKKGDSASMPAEPIPPIRKRYVLSDATIEKVAEVMVENPRGISIVVDELSGLFSTFNRTGREGDRSFWLEAFNGNGAKPVDRIGRGSIYVPYVCASIFGTIQPDIVSNLLLSTKSGGSGGDGLLQRFQLMVMVNTSEFKYVDRQPNYTARSAYSETIISILESDPMDFGAKKDKYTDDVFFRFSADANELFKEWSEELNKKIADESEHNPSLSAHLGKYEGLFASIALILFYADKVKGVVSDDTIPLTYAIKAKGWCNFLESQAREIYDIDRISEKKKDALEDKIIKKVRELEVVKKLPMSYGEISQLIKGASADDCRKALKGIAIEQDRKVYGLRGLTSNV
jgi:putative DNA primase/helicase